MPFRSAKPITLAFLFADSLTNITSSYADVSQSRAALQSKYRDDPNFRWSKAWIKHRNDQDYVGFVAYLDSEKQQLSGNLIKD